MGEEEGATRRRCVRRFMSFVVGVFTFCRMCVCFKTPCKNFSYEIIKYILSYLISAALLPTSVSGQGARRRLTFDLPVPFHTGAEHRLALGLNGGESRYILSPSLPPSVEIQLYTSLALLGTSSLLSCNSYFMLKARHHFSLASHHTLPRPLDYSSDCP